MILLSSFAPLEAMLLTGFVFGLVFGSFLNVMIYRLKTPPRRGGTTKDIILGRSFCPECKNLLKWYDLIPILSFIWLRRRCRYCHKKISWQYPIVELISGLLWVMIFYKFGILPVNIYYLFIFSLFLVIVVYDFKWRIIPDKIIYPAVVIVLIYNLFNAFKLGNFKIFVEPLFAALVVFLFFFLFFYFSRGRAMGLGDAKLAFLIGLFLSPLLTIVAFISAFIIGAAFGIILIGLGKKTLKSQVAFGPFLVLGATIAFFLSDFIINFFSALGWSAFGGKI
jgi:prepilin signal peptidase PulO-like enzyme (type II secretory pathway)